MKEIAVGIKPHIRKLQQNTQMSRRNAIRKILTGRHGYDAGFINIAEIRKALSQHGHDASHSTLEVDLRELGAAKHTAPGEKRSYWLLPAWNPAVRHEADLFDQDTVRNEVASRLSSFGVDVFRHGREVIILTEADCGLMLARWIARLTWPGMIHVRDHADSVSILCETADGAEEIVTGLVG